MGDEHLDTILATKSDEFIKSSVENLVPNPSESEGEQECDVPACDDFTTFFNILFDADDDFSSSNDELILFFRSSPVNSLFSNQFQWELMKQIVILRKKFILSRNRYMITVSVEFYHFEAQVVMGGDGALMMIFLLFFLMANGFLILHSLLTESHSYQLNNQIKVLLSKEVGTGDGFAQDMDEHCYLVRKEMEERVRLIAELEKLTVSAGAARYVQILRRRRDMGVMKLRLLRDLLRHARDETHERQLEEVAIGNLLKVSALVFRLRLADSLAPSSIVAGLWPTDVSLRTCAAGDVMVSIAGSASIGSVRRCKTTSKRSAIELRVVVVIVQQDEFNKIVLDYQILRQEALTLEDVMATLNSKEIKERSKAEEDNGEGLCVRRRTDHRDSRQSRGKSRSKSRGGRIKCYIFQSEDHLKINYPKNNHKKSTGYVKKDEQPSSSGSVQLGDNKECKIRGIGKVKIQLRDGSSFVLHNVMYIPELKRNLISLGTLEKRGFTVKLQSGKVKVINGFMVVLSGIRRDNCVYSLDGHAMEGELNSSVEEKDSLAQVWHKRLDISARRDYRFGAGRHTTHGVIDYVYSDLWGSSQVESLRENQTGRAVKKMRTDNGLEFCNREFEQLCIKNGIARHLTVVGTSQQNRLAEPIEKKTTMKMWSGHPSDYEMLRSFGCVTHPHDKQGKLEPRAVKCVLLGYPEGMKGYRLYRLDDKSPKIVTGRNVVFNESVMYKDTLKDSDTGADKSVKELHVEEEDTHELFTYQEAVACEDSSKCKAAMKEEMDSLRKNKTWELVDHSAGQKLVSCKWLFKIKEGIEGVQNPRYQARLVARGFTQMAGTRSFVILIKQPDLFQEPPQNCPKCGNPVDGQYCQGCALLRKELKEVWFTYCIENGIFQDTSESSNDNTNVVNAPQEPFVVKQDPGKNSSQSSPHINHHCCYGCGDPLEDIFAINVLVSCVGKVLSLAWETILEIEHAFEDKHCQPDDILELFRRLHNDVQNIQEELAVYINTPSWDRPTICYNDDDDEDCTIAITPILSTEKLDNSLSIGNEHLDTILDFSDSNDDSTSIDDDSFSIDDIEYVEASPPDSKPVSLEAMKIVILKIGGIDADILLTIKDDILREELLNINLLIANIEALTDNPTPYSDFMTKSSSTSLNFLLEETNTFDNSLPESETFCFDSNKNSSGSTTTRADISLPDYKAFYDNHVKEISSGNTTTHSDFSLYDSFVFDLSINPFPPADRSDFYEFADELAHIISLLKYDCFSFKNEPNLRDFTMDVVEDIFLIR
nr:retrovirus-related Pol polyprotein from transposon TNT 1-94 [Tanacetum cinerariifolium]